MKNLISVLISWALIFLPISIQALPLGQKVVNGNASFKTNINTMNITTSNKAIINYNSFNINKNEAVNFIQPSVSSVVLNRVIEANPSTIMGALNANGKVFLINPAGIVFGASSSVNTNSFLATTLDIKNSDFINGNYIFSQSKNRLPSYILQQGKITVSPEGFVVLASPLVSSGGLIVAKSGKIRIGAVDNFYLNFDQSGLVKFDYKPNNPAKTDVVISKAVAKTLMQDVVNNKKVEEATNIVEENGVIKLVSGSGTALVSGKLNADKKGSIGIKANNYIALLDGAKLSANGGGKIVVFSQKDAYSSKGAVLSAKDKGFVELSAKRKVIYDGSFVDTSSEDGEFGLFYTDPQTQEISNNVNISSNYFSEATKSILVDDAVTIKTNGGNIELDAPSITLEKNSQLQAGSGDITLKADSATDALIDIKDGVQISGTKIDLQASSYRTSQFDSDSDDPLLNAMKAVEDFVIDMPLTPIAYKDATTSSTINIGAATINGTSIDVSSKAVSDVSVSALFTVLALAYGKSEATSTLHIGSGAILKGAGDVTLQSEASTTNSVSGKATNIVSDKSKKTQANFALAYSKTTTTSSAIVENGAKINADNFKLISIGNKDISTSATGASLSAGTLGAAVAISDSTSNIKSSLGGTIVANSVEVSSTTNIEKIKTSSSASVGNGFVYKKLLESNADKSKVTDKTKTFTEGKTPNTSSKSGTKKPAFSAAFTYSKHENNSEAKIAKNANITSKGNTKVNSDIIYGENGSYKNSSDVTIIGNKGIKSIAIATIDSTEENTKGNSFSGAVDITDITNNTKAFIDDDSVVNSGGDLKVRAKTYLGYNIEWKNIKKIDSIKGIVPVVPDANFRGRLFSSYAQSNAQGTKTSLSGSYNYFKSTGDAEAYIGKNVAINQGLDSYGSVELFASNDISALNFAGVIGWTYFGTKAKTAVGGSYLDVDYINNTKAYIKSGSTIKASNLQVFALKNANNLSISTAGGSGTNAISGSFSKLKTTDDTYAYIDGATIITANGINKKYNDHKSDTNLRVNAQNQTEFSNGTGGLIKGKNVGVGASGSYNEIKRDTQAYINNSTIERTLEDLAGLHYIKAYNGGFIHAYALSGSIISPEPPKVSNEGLTSADSEGRFGFTISGDASVNKIDDDADAHIDSSTFTSGGQKVKLLAENGSGIGAYSGSGAFNFSVKSAGLAGSYSGNYFSNSVNSYIKDSSLHVKSLEIKSQNSGAIDTLSGSGSIGIGIADLAGSVSLNDIQNSTFSYIDNSDILLSENLDLSSIDDTGIKSLAGALSISKSLGIGLSFARNKIQNSTQSYIENSSLDTGDISLFSNQKNSIDNIAATIGSTELSGAALAGSFSINDIDNILKSYVTNIQGDKSIASSGDIDLKSLDESTIESITGSAGTSDVLGVGVSTLHNKITNNVDAYLTDVNSISSKNLSIRAISDKDITATSVGGAGAGTAAVSGSAIIDDVEDNINAYIYDSTVLASGSLLVHSIEQNSLTTYGGTASGAGTVGIGGTVVVNTLKNNIASSIKKSKIDAQAKDSLKAPILDASSYKDEEDIYGINILSLANENITTHTANASGAGTTAFAASGNFNIIGDTLQSYILNSNINQNTLTPNSNQDVIIRALTNNKIDTKAGGLAGAGAAGVGGSLSDTHINNHTSAYINSSKVKAQNLVEVRVKGLEHIDPRVSSGSGAGTISLAGSVSIVNVDNDDEAYIKTSTVSSAKDLKVLSKEQTYMAARVGTLSGAGIVGVGGSVIINNIKNSSIAHVDDSSINAKNDMAIYSYNAAYLNNIAATGALGAFGGSGTTIINTTDLTTKAYTHHEPEESVLINQNPDYVAPNQSVTVKAADYVNVADNLGAFGLGLVGVGGSVDVTTIKNDTSAYLDEDTKLFAKKDLDIVAQSKKHCSVNSLAFAGGTYGVSGSVIVANIGSNIKKDATDALKNTKSILNKIVSSAGNEKLGTSPLGSKTNKDISNQNSNIGFNSQFDTKPTINNMTKAYIASNSKVNVGNDISIDANNLITKLAIQSGGGAGGILGAGGAVALAYLGADNRAYIGNSVVIDAKDLDLASKYNIDNISLNSYAGSIGAVGLGADLVKFANYYKNIATIGDNAFIVSTNSVNLNADTKEDISARGYGANIGAIAAGSSTVYTYDKGETGVKIQKGSKVYAGDGGISMLTTYSTDADAKAWAAAGGMSSGTGSYSNVIARPTLDTLVEDGAILTTKGDVNINTLSYGKLFSSANGYGLGGVQVGLSDAEAYRRVYINSVIGNNVLINAKNFKMLTYDNTDTSNDSKLENNTIKSYAKSSVGTLVGGDGAYSRSANYSYLNSSMGENSIVNTKKDITIKTKSYAYDLSESQGNAYGVASYGSTKSDTFNYGKTNFELNKGAKLIANNDILVDSYGEKDAYSRDYGGVGGVLSGGETEANIKLGNEIKITVDDDTKIIANNGDVGLSAAGNIYAYADSSTHSAGIVTKNTSLSNIKIDKQDIKIDIKESKIVGNKVNITSNVSYLGAYSNAYSKTSAVGSDSKSYAYLTLLSNVGVSVDGATIVGYDAINIKATQYIDKIFSCTQAKTTIGKSLIGVLHAKVKNNPTFNSKIELGKDTKLQSDNQDFEYVVPDWGKTAIFFSDIPTPEEIKAAVLRAKHYGKNADIENHSVSYWVEEKVWKFVDDVWQWVTQKTEKHHSSKSHEIVEGIFKKNKSYTHASTVSFLKSPTDAKKESFRDEVQTQQNNDFNRWHPGSISGELNKKRGVFAMAPVPGGGDDADELLQGASLGSSKDNDEHFEEIDVGNHEDIEPTITYTAPTYREMIEMSKDEKFVIIDNRFLGGKFLERYTKMMMFDRMKNDYNIKFKPIKTPRMKELVVKL